MTRRRAAATGRFKRLSAAALLAAITLAVFSPALRAGFTNWDDPEYVTLNPAVLDPSLASIGAFFTRPFVGSYVPLTMLSYAADRLLFGPGPFGFHLTNVLLHAGSAVLVFFILLRLVNAPGAAFCGAALFAWHPLRVESVAWIAERKDVLSALLFFAALAAWLAFRERGGRARYAGALALYLLSLSAKGMGVTLPAVQLLVVWFRRGRVERRDLVEIAPFAALAALFAAITVAAQQVSGTIGMQPDLRAGAQLLVAAHGLVFYLVKTVVPAGLCAYYPYPSGALPAVFWLAPLGVLLVAALAIAAGRRSRLVPFALGLFVVTLLPVLQVVPIGHAVAADRYTYIPSLGLSVLAAGVLSAGARRSALMRLVPLVAGLVLLAYAGAAWSRCHVWTDSVRLWSDVLAKCPGTALAHHNRGLAFAEAGRQREAIADFDAAIGASPSYADAFVNRGLSFEAIGRPDRAEADYSRAIELDPGYPAAYNNRGVLRMRRGRLEEALGDVDAAIGRSPDYVDAHFNRGLILSRMERFAEAAASYERALALAPADGEIRAARDSALQRAGGK